MKYYSHYIWESGSEERETKNPVSQSFDYNTGFTYLLFKKYRNISLYPDIYDYHRNDVLCI